MGLDMYLSKRTPSSQLSRVFTEGEAVEGTLVKVNGKDFIETEVGYWRKANEIHNYFVQKLANGVDKCQEIPVTTEQLQELLTTVDKVLESSKLISGQVHDYTEYSNGQAIKHYSPGKIMEDPTVAKELLPTTDGFFFGATDYDEYYIHDLKQTKDILKGVLKDAQPGDTFVYQASW